MDDEKNFLLKIRFGKDRTVEGHFLSDGDMVSAEGAAMKIIGSIPEESINDVYDYLADLVAEMAAMTDSPEEAERDIRTRIIRRASEFRAVKDVVGRFRSSKALLKDLS